MTERATMSVSIRQLCPGDESVLEMLATSDPDFDLDGRGSSLLPLEPDAARGFLSNPAVQFWTALDGDEVVGFLYCIVLPLRSGEGRELLLYEIGVRKSARRRGAGRALLDSMERWMMDNDVGEVWVCADNPAAVQFYRGFGFEAPGDQPVYMTRRPY
jgi:ribosomal protein S18 acetylase RimI-like enzyme